MSWISDFFCKNIPESALMTELDGGIYITLTRHHDTTQTLPSRCWKPILWLPLTRDKIVLFHTQKNMLFASFQNLLGRRKKDSYTVNQICSVLSCQIRLRSSCVSKDNKERDASRKNPAVFSRYRSLEESQMIPSFCLLCLARLTSLFFYFFLNSGTWLVSVEQTVGFCLIAYCEHFCPEVFSVSNTWDLLHPAAAWVKVMWLSQLGVLSHPSSNIHRSAWGQIFTAEVKVHI